jgi:hypothetical protein
LNGWRPSLAAKSHQHWQVQDEDESAFLTPENAEQVSVNSPNAYGESTDVLHRATFKMRPVHLHSYNPSEQLLRILRSIVPTVCEHFALRNAEYGEGSNVLGVKGQYADLNRKMLKLHRYIWEGRPVPDGAEGIDTIAYELIGHLLLLIDSLEQAAPEDGQA